MPQYEPLQQEPPISHCPPQQNHPASQQVEPQATPEQQVPSLVQVS